MSEPATKEKSKTKTLIEEPKLYNVIYINDEITTFEFVVETLVAIFNYSRLDAEDMTQRISDSGSAVVATLPYEMAEQKGVEVTMLAKTHNFPLIIKIEVDE